MCKEFIVYLFADKKTALRWMSAELLKMPARTRQKKKKKTRRAEREKAALVVAERRRNTVLFFWAWLREFFLFFVVVIAADVIIFVFNSFNVFNFSFFVFKNSFNVFNFSFFVFNSFNVFDFGFFVLNLFDFSFFVFIVTFFFFFFSLNELRGNSYFTNQSVRAPGGGKEVAAEAESLYRALNITEVEQKETKAKPNVGTTTKKT